MYLVMRGALTLIFSVTIFLAASAQQSFFSGASTELHRSSRNRTVGDDNLQIRLERFIDHDQKYLYKQNVEGRVFAKNGARSAPLYLNYHMFWQQMLIFEEDGDTLVMERNPQIEFIVAGTDLFYHHPTQGFFIMKSDVNEKVWLAVKKVLAVDEHHVLSQNSPFSGAPLSDDARYNVVYRHRDERRLSERFFFKHVERYYIIDSNKRIAVASRRAFVRAFPGHRAEIDHFIRTNAIQFATEQEVRRVYQYCLQLDGSGSLKIVRADR